MELTKSPALIRWLSANPGPVLGASVFVGLLWPDAASALRPWLGPSIAGLLAIAVMRISGRALFARMREPLRLGWLLLFLLLLCPVLVWLLLSASGLPAGMVTAITLMAATPPLFSSPAIALLFGLDAALSLSIVVFGTLAGPFTLALVTAVLPIEFEIEPVELTLRLSLLVGGCFAAGAVLRRLIGAARIDAAKPSLDTIVLALLVIFAIAVMDGVRDRLAESPAEVFTMLGLAFAFSLALQVLGTVAHLRWRMPAALAVGYSTGNRAMGLILAVVPAGVAPEVTLYFAVGQIPIYVLPMVQGPLYRYLMRRYSD